MPAPGTQQGIDPEVRTRIDAMLTAMADRNLAAEIASLRQEIAMLRAELAPVPSLIVTGRQALDEFKRLTGR